MRKLLILALLALVPDQISHAAPERLRGIGKDRENITAEELTSRSKSAADAQEFWVLRQSCTRKAPERILHGSYYPKIETEAEKWGIDLYLPAAIFYIESCGDPLAKSPTGPAGLGQHSKASAKEQGLKIKTERRVIGTKVVRKAGWVGKGKKRRFRQAITKPRYGMVVVEDERLNPDRAIEATMSRLAQRTRWFGDISWAVVDYHMGTGNLMHALSLYLGHKVKAKNAKEEIAKNGLTWQRVFFNNTPYFKPDLYNFLVKLRAKNDFSPTYLFRVLKARELLQLYRQNPSAYDARWKGYQDRFKPRVAPNLMWTLFGPEDIERLKFETLEQIQAAQGKDLVLLPEPWARYGITVRLDGKSKIAEKNPAHQADYIAATPESVGCLLYVVAELQRLEEKRFELLETNSLVRDTGSQDALKIRNRNARTSLPTHTIGWGFDLPKKKMKGWRKKDLHFILYDMELQGMLVFILESKDQDTTHVGPHPNFQQFFEKFYRDTVPADQQIRKTLRR